MAALLTTAATAIIFEERFTEGAWTYLLFIPALYFVFSRFRTQLGPPRPLEEHLGRYHTGQYLLPFQRYELGEGDFRLERILVPLDGSALAEHALPVAELLTRTAAGRLDLLSVRPSPEAGDPPTDPGPGSDLEAYLERMAWTHRRAGLTVATTRPERTDCRGHRRPGGGDSRRSDRDGHA